MNTDTMNWWCKYQQAVARMEMRGIPIDYEMYSNIKRGWTAIRLHLINQINAKASVFEGVTFKKKALLEWCGANRIRWPKKENATGKLVHSFDKKNMKRMARCHPYIRQLRDTLDILGKFNRIKLVIDPDTHRHYYDTNTFRSVTGRNQPKGFIFSGPKWWRCLIIPESQDHVLVYVDYVAQEIGIAAALSGDPVMQQMYAAGDCHMDLAIRAGAVPLDATKQSHGKIRAKYKTVNLAVLYGQGAKGIAERLSIPLTDSERLLADHRRLFPVFWDWSEKVVQGAYDRRRIVTPCGWASNVPPFSNERTWMNWPMQAAGADVMRLTMIYLDRQNVRILAPVHDGFLLSCRTNQLNDLKAAVNHACALAVEHVLPGSQLKLDFECHRDAFSDEGGAEMWKTVTNALREVKRG